MSITFTPDAGTWTSHHYYEVDPHDGAGDVANGVIRFVSEEPSLDCHNSGGHWLITQLGLALDVPFEERHCGYVDAKDIAALRVRINELNDQYREDGNLDTYELRKVRAFADLLLHCQYHQCGLRWG